MSNLKNKDLNLKVRLLLEFFNNFNRWPKTTETFKNVEIGKFATSIRNEPNKISEDNKALLTKLNFPFSVNLKKERTHKNVILLIDYYKKFGKWPKMRKEYYKGVNIGNFSHNLKGMKIKIDNNDFKLLSKMGFFSSYYHKKILLLLEFLNTNKRYPYSNETFKGFNIYRFANSIKKGNLDDKISEEDKKLLTENIYFNFNYIQSIYHEKVLALIKFHNIYNRWPKFSECFEGIDIGNFASLVRRSRAKISDIDKIKLKEKGFIFH